MSGKTGKTADECRCPCDCPCKCHLEGKDRESKVAKKDKLLGFRKKHNLGKEGESSGAKPGEPKPQEPKPKPEQPKPEQPMSDVPLKPLSLDLNENANRLNHHTQEYDEQRFLVVRRGECMTIEIEFSEKYDAVKDRLMLDISTGKNPTPGKSLYQLLVGRDSIDAKDPHKWGVEVENIKDKKATFKIFIPANAAVGKYSLIIKTKRGKARYQKNFDEDNDEFICVLFNPFCAADVCYIQDPILRHEYVMEEEGVVGMGSAWWPYAKPWHFGQFEEICLLCALYLFEKGDLKAVRRSNPYDVARFISAMVNCQDDQGILVGNWSGDYEGGTKPTSWGGSVKILKEFMVTNNKSPVSFAQCWVFSAVTTSLCRAIGLPTRSVTNFASAHDTDGSTTIDQFCDENGEAIEWMNDDSVWNFHVWNEMFCKLVEHPSGEYDGWHAFDATPQETSEGQFQCGPCPLKAIKERNLSIGFDTRFIFSEVNGDRLTWQVTEDGEKVCIKRDPTAVGKKIVTKSVGQQSLDNITYQYKYKEGSEEELQAEKQQISPLGVEVQDMSPSRVLIGQDFDSCVQVKNITDKRKDITITTRIKHQFYTGSTGKKVKNETTIFVLKPHEERTIVVKVTEAEYYEKNMGGNSSLVCSTFGKISVKDDPECQPSCFIFENVVDVELPKLHIKVVGEPTKECEFIELEIGFKNTTNQPIKSGKFCIEPTKYIEGNEIALCKTKIPVPPHTEYKQQVKVKRIPGKKPEKITIDVVFDDPCDGVLDCLDGGVEILLK